MRWLFACVALVSAGVGSARPLARVLPLEPYRKGVAARVTVAGKPRLFMLDTGSGVTIISPALAKEIGCRPFGALIGFRMTGDRLDTPRCDGVRLDWASMGLTADHAGVYDVAPLVAKDAAPIDGILGLDVFAGRTITIDFAGGVLTVETPASAAARGRGAIPIKARLAREEGGRALAVYVDVPTPQGTLAMELDSGNGGTLLVSKPYAAALGLDPAAPGPQQGRFAVAPGVEAAGTIFTPDLIIDGNLGMPFLKHWLVTLDLAAGRVWLRRNRVLPPPGMGTSPAAK